jgi:hypothetical protein
VALALLDSVRAPSGPDASLYKSQVGEFTVSTPVRWILKVIVVLVIDFAGIKGKLGRVVNVNNLFAQRIRVVALAWHQFKASL